ncbi:MAG: bifunctional adenosylcobinamide kinase/adenosylcobinamide-phosphate guanylyltransferase [Clostridiales bacterium]|nr:bifunctional adenosylcobinamide kinase/adenosylcobinamide-phosphate guanylyltransferase [Clostridiales bacterium]
MILITGGAYQGKSSFAGTLAEDAVCDKSEKRKILEHIHLIIATEMREGRDPYPVLERWMEAYPDIIFTVDELGCGIVPATAFDREWRETTGRICCRLAQRAEAVYRVTCGIAVQIK